MQNRVFFPQSALDQWNVDGKVELQQGELTLVGAGRRYRLVEAVRVLREVGGKGDADELVGRVKARADLEQLGAEIVETSMLLGDTAYDVDTGWLGTPVGTFAQFAGEPALAPESVREGVASGGVAVAKSDEDLLSRLLAKPSARS